MATIEHFMRLIPKGKRIYYNLVRTARSGLSRVLDFYIVDGDEICCVNSCISAYTIHKMNCEGSIRVHGMQFDAAVKVISDLGRSLHDDANTFKHSSL